MTNMTRKKLRPITEQLRQAIESADASRYRISKSTGVTEAALSRFVNGKAGLSLESVDRIGEFLDLELVTRQK